jgi:hypothetical protein
MHSARVVDRDRPGHLARKPRRRHRAVDLGEPAAQVGILHHPPAQNPPRHVLELPVAPALGLFDSAALLGVVRVERRIGIHRLELARDARGPLDPASVQLERRHRATPEAGEPQVDALVSRQHVREVVVDALHLEHRARRV